MDKSDVAHFSSRIGKYGLASPNKFRVMFTKIPSIVGDQQDMRHLSIMCDQITIAGRTVQSAMNMEYGLRREIAYNGPSYEVMTVSFVCTSDMIEKAMLDKWNDMIVSASNGYNVAYYDDYVGEMNVATLDRHGELTGYRINYHKIWPKTVTSIDLNRATTNATLRVTTQMSYENWTTNSINPEAAASRSEFEQKVISSGIRNDPYDEERFKG